MSPRHAIRRRQHPEDVEVSHIQQLVGVLGGKYYTIGTRRSRGRACPSCGAFVASTDHGTRQTEGLPDLLVFLPASRIAPGEAAPPTLVAVEAKAPRGRLSPEQVEFREWCRAARVPHVAGTYDAFIHWCLEHRYLGPRQVPHYRLPAPAGADKETHVHD